jgi:hypothetical protein
LKNPVTSLGIEPVTFELVAQCLNYVTECPLSIRNININTYSDIADKRVLHQNNYSKKPSLNFATEEEE